MARGGQNRTRLLIITFLVTALLLLTLDLRGFNIAEQVRSTTQTVLSPFEKFTNKIFSPVGSFFGNLKNLSSSSKQIDELKHAVVGGDIGEDGKESVRALNYNAIFTYAVKAIQELSDIVKQQQQQIEKLINIILTS